MFVGTKTVLYMVFMFTASLVLSSCRDHEPPQNQHGYEEGSIMKSDKDAPIPRELVHHLEKQYIAIYRKEKKDTTLSDLEISLQVPRRLLQVKVFLKQKNENTLRADTQFLLPQGGGTIDLAEFVNQGKGIFYLGFDFSDITEDQLDKMQVYFVSNSKRFRVQGELYGAGCGKFFNISDYFHNSVRTKGLESVAADLRYLGQIIGSFYFTFIESEALYVGSASFVDTRYPDTACYSRN